MFRKMRREKQQLSGSECIEILRNEPRGVLCVLGDENYPYGMPMNFIYDETENKIYFHGAKAGHKVDSIKKHDKVSFCVYDKGVKKEGHWSLNIRSVIVFGKMNIIENDEKAIDKIGQLARKYVPDEKEIEQEMKHIPKALCMELTIEHMTGKLVNEA